MHDRIRQSRCGDLGSIGNGIIRPLGVYVCPQGGTDIAQSRCCYETSSLNIVVGARTLGLCSGSTEGSAPAVTLTLTLESPASLLQAVQSIGNLGQQLGQGKELWMAPLHPFLLQSILRVRDFLDQLVDVDGEEGEFQWPCHIWLVTPLDSWDLPSLYPSPTHSTEPVDL